MEIKRNGSQPSGKGPADYFTGTVRIDPLFEAPEPARVRGASVTFEPGARTTWHTSTRSNIDRHLGRWVGTALGRCHLGNPGGRRDLVFTWREALAWSHSNDRHEHIAVQEALNGKVVDWMEHVSDEQFRARA